MHTRQKALLIILIFLFSLIEATLLTFISIKGIKPDILLILIIYTSFYADWRFALKAGLLAGILKDALSIGVFGLNAFIFGISALIIALYSKKVYRDHISRQVFISFAVSLSVMVIYYLTTNIFLPLPQFTIYLWTIILPAAIYTALLYPLLSLLLSRTLRIT